MNNDGGGDSGGRLEVNKSGVGELHEIGDALRQSVSTLVSVSSPYGR